MPLGRGLESPEEALYPPHWAPGTHEEGRPARCPKPRVRLWPLLGQGRAGQSLGHHWPRDAGLLPAWPGADTRESLMYQLLPSSQTTIKDVEQSQFSSTGCQARGDRKQEGRPTAMVSGPAPLLSPLRASSSSPCWLSPRSLQTHSDFSLLETSFLWA